MDVGYRPESAVGVGTPVSRPHHSCLLKSGDLEMAILRYPEALLDFDKAIANAQKYDRTYNLPWDRARRLELLLRMGLWDEVASGCAGLFRKCQTKI